MWRREVKGIFLKKNQTNNGSKIKYTSKEKLHRMTRVVAVPGGAVAAVEHTEAVLSRNEHQCGLHVHIIHEQIHPPFPPTLTGKPVTWVDGSLPANVGCGIRAAAAGDVDRRVLNWETRT